MVGLSSFEAGMPLRNREQHDKVGAFYAGMLMWVIVPMMPSLVRGDWGALWCLALPAGLLLIGKGAQHFTPDVYVVLYPERLEFPQHRGRSLVLAWSTVTALRWTPGNREEPAIEVSLPKDVSWPTWPCSIKLQNVSPADQLLLIQYLRLAVAEEKQEGWGPFCRRWAISIVENLERAEHPQPPETEGSPLLAGFLERIGLLSFKRPFLEGMIFPLAFVLMLFPEFLRRRVWWAMAAIMAVSAIINIRMIWGFWVSPMTEIVFGTAVVSFCFGLFAPAGDEKPENEFRPPFVIVILWLALALIGCPLLANAKELGWLQIPIPMLLLALAPVIVLLAPGFVLVARTQRHRKEQEPLLEADAIHRWEAYLETGRLPKPEI